MKKVSIIGAGTWGTTLGQIAADNKHQVTIWAHDKETRNMLARQLPHISFSCERDENFFRTDLLIIVVASRFFRTICEQISGHVQRQTIIVSATKGLEEDTNLTPFQIMRDILPRGSKLAVLSGPNIAPEIARKLPAASVVAAESPSTSKLVQKLMSNNYFRIYINIDIIGVELGGILKNVIAIAAGVSDGLELGDNARAALITRGISEISRLAVYLGAKPSTLLGLAGIGDLITTCSSAHSRNYKVGVALAKGKSIKEIINNSTSVAEGIKTAKVAYFYGIQNKLDLPITEQVYKIIYRHYSPHKAIDNLMNRKLKYENQGI